MTTAKNSGPTGDEGGALDGGDFRAEMRDGESEADDRSGTTAGGTDADRDGGDTVTDAGGATGHAG